jgi:lysozyme family protein
MRQNFAASLAAVLKEEGGYANHPKDPGGATNFGITQRVYDAWRNNNGKPPRSVKMIEKAEVDTIYYQQYWVMVRGDQLPAGVDLAMFDYGVNSGPSRAIKELQRVLGVKVDGVPGNVTLSTVGAANPIKVVNDLLDARMRFLKDLSTFGTFGKGWVVRVSRVRAQAMEMARQAPSVPDGTSLPRPQPLPPTVPPAPPVQVPKTERTIGQVMLWIVMAIVAGLAAYLGLGR